MTFRRALANIADYLTALRCRLEYRIKGRDHRMQLDRATRLCATLFERRLRSRGAWFAFDEDTATYRVENIDGLEARVSLSNIAREIASDGDIYHAVRFADNMLLGITIPDDWSKVKHKIFWAIETNDLVEQSDLATHLSDQTHQVPVLFDLDSRSIMQLPAGLLLDMNVSEEAVAKAADENLSAELRNAELAVTEQDGVKMGFIHSQLPFKAALILAPNLREKAESVLGWPLWAVIPNRDWACLFNARDFDGVSEVFEVMPGLGGWVLDKYDFDAYPLSTEIFEISDEGVRAVAEFRRHPPGKIAEEAQEE